MSANEEIICWHDRISVRGAHEPGLLPRRPGEECTV